MPEKLVNLILNDMKIYAVVSHYLKEDTGVVKRNILCVISGFHHGVNENFALLGCYEA
jgi:hypothetical protein